MLEAEFRPWMVWQKLICCSFTNSFHTYLLCIVCLHSWAYLAYYGYCWEGFIQNILFGEIYWIRAMHLHTLYPYLFNFVKIQHSDSWMFWHFCYILTNELHTHYYFWHFSWLPKYQIQEYYDIFNDILTLKIFPFNAVFHPILWESSATFTFSHYNFMNSLSLVSWIFNHILTSKIFLFLALFIMKAKTKILWCLYGWFKGLVS